MKVTLISCGSATNESEHVGSLPGDGWSDHSASVRVIELRHWLASWADAHTDLVNHECEKVTEKAAQDSRDTLSRTRPQLPI